jgi:cytochrome c556
MVRTDFSVSALAAIGLAGAVMAQDTVLGEGEGWTGITEPEEVIEARRVLMIEIERQMKPIDAFTVGGQADVAALKSAAAAIEPMLLAFPHLFPPTTNLYDPSVLEPSTIALPAIWQDFATFRTLAEAAEAAAAATAAAEGAEPLRTAARNLRASCDACHTLFTEPYTPPQVTREDLEFDFDSVFQKD